jgi:integrase
VVAVRIATTAGGLPIFDGPMMFGLRELPEIGAKLDFSTLPIRRGNDVAAWKPKYPTLLSVCSQYLHEHAVENTADANRAAQSLLEWTSVLGIDFDCNKFTVGDARRVLESMRRRGLAPGSLRRIMAWGSAALHHGNREGRIKIEIPKFPKIQGGAPRCRWFSREEHLLLMGADKPARLHRFYVLAFATGARSRAIETLTWDRVDLANRVIDYRIPGKDHKNKRRAVVPIGDSLLAELTKWERVDDYVIGCGPSGRPTSVHHLGKRALRSIGIDEKGVCRHVARHTVASWMLQGDKARGIEPSPIHHVAEMLGDRVGMIEKVYGHITPAHLMDATRVLP